MTLPRVVVRVLGCVMAVVAATVFVVLLVVPRLTGGAALTVLSGSMTPAYPVGSVVVVRPVSPEDVAAGDVITYANKTGTSFTTHRVIEVQSTEGGLEFTTKGDANRGADADPVPEAALRGQVWFHVKYLGFLREAVSSPIGLAAIAGLVSLTLVWDRAASFVRRRLALPSRLPADVPESPPTKIEGTPQIADVGPGAFTSAPGPTDAAATASGDDAILDRFELSGVSVDLRPTTRVEQQLMLARLNAGAFGRGKVIEVLGLVRGHVVSIGALHMVVSVTGTPEHLDGVEQLLRPYGLVEASRSAVVHVGGLSAPETHVPRPPEPVGDPVTNLKSLVLRPPVPPSLTLAGSSSNGHRHEGSDQ